MKFISVFASLAACGVASAVVVTQKPSPYEVTEVRQVCVVGSPNNVIKSATVQEIKVEFNGVVLGQGWTELDQNKCAPIAHKTVIGVKPVPDISVSYEIREKGAVTGISEISHDIPTRKIFPSSTLKGIITSPVDFIIGYETDQPSRTAYTACVDTECTSYQRPATNAIIIETQIKHASVTKPVLSYKPLKSMGYCMEPKDPQQISSSPAAAEIVMRKCTGADSQRFGIDKPTKRIEYFPNNIQKSCLEAVTPTDPSKPVYLKISPCSTSRAQKFSFIAKGYVYSIEAKQVLTIENYGVDIEATEPRVVTERKIKPFAAVAKTKPISVSFSQTWNRGINNIAVFRPLKANGNRAIAIEIPNNLANSDSVVMKPYSKGVLSQSWGINSHGQIVSKFNKEYCLGVNPSNKLIVTQCEKPSSPAIKAQMFEIRSSIQNGITVNSIYHSESQKYVEIQDCGTDKNIPNPIIELNPSPTCTKPNQLWK